MGAASGHGAVLGWYKLGWQEPGPSCWGYLFMWTVLPQPFLSWISHLLHKHL